LIDIDIDVDIASRSLATLSPALAVATPMSSWSLIVVVVVGVGVLSPATRPSPVGGCRRVADLSAGAWLLLLMEFCRLRVMPRGGPPPTSRLGRRSAASPAQLGVNVDSALSWLLSGGSLHTDVHVHYHCYRRTTDAKKLSGC